MPYSHDRETFTCDSQPDAFNVGDESAPLCARVARARVTYVFSPDMRLEAIDLCLPHYEEMLRAEADHISDVSVIFH